MTEPICQLALELARPEVRGIRVRLLGVTASNLGEREQLGLFASEDPRRRAAIEAADELRDGSGRAPSRAVGCSDAAAGAVRARSAEPARPHARGRAGRGSGARRTPHGS